MRKIVQLVFISVLILGLYLYIPHKVDAVTWETKTVFTTGNVGLSSSIDVDGSTYVVSYFDSTNGDLRFSKSSDGGDNWTHATVDSTGSVGRYTSIKVVSTNTYIISYQDSFNSDLKFARTTDGGSNWTTTTVESTNIVGLYTSIDFDGTTYVIAHYDQTNTALRFAYSTDGGSNWTTSQIDNAAAVGEFSSIAVVSTDTYIVSYRDATNTSLKYAKTTDGGDTWSTSTVDNTENTGQYTSITFDSAGNYLIAYKGGAFPNDGTYMIKSTNSGASWGTRELVKHSDNAPGLHNSIYAIDASTYLVYSIDGTYAQNYFSISVDGGDTWTSTTINDADNGGNYTEVSWDRTIAVDADGNYLISWKNADSGDMMIFKGIPDSTAPSITLTAVSDPNPDSTPTISGSTTDAAGTVSSVEFQMDGTSGSWTACTADDGTFDEATETFSCTSSTLTDGSHTVYVRATDNAPNVTASDSYSSDTFTVDTTTPTYSAVAVAKTDTTGTITYTTSESTSTQLEWGASTSYGTTTSETDTSPRVTSHSVSLTGLTKCTTYHFRLLGSDSSGNTGQSADNSFRTTGCDSTPSTDTGSGTFQIDTNGTGGVFSPIIDSDTGGETVIAIVEEGTFTFDAYFSSQVSTVYSGGAFTNPMTGLPTIGVKLPTSMVNAGGILGLRQSCGIAWQIGNVQNMWFKAYQPAGSGDPGAKIIPELQAHPSILALSYNLRDLTPLGAPWSRFNPQYFKIAFSPNGYTWSILPSSVVDTTNQTIAAIHRIGGYYMIVAGCSRGGGIFRQSQPTY